MNCLVFKQENELSLERREYYIGLVWFGIVRFLLHFCTLERNVRLGTKIGLVCTNG